MKEAFQKLDEADRLQGMEWLRSAAYNSFNDRRSYEWKFSLAIWTALALMTVGLVRPIEAGTIFPFHGKRYGLIATILGLGLNFVHAYFHNRMARANAIDKDIALFYSKQIRAAIGLNFPQPLTDRIKALPKRPKNSKLQWLQWGHITQSVITIFLTALVVTLVWVSVS